MEKYTPFEIGKAYRPIDGYYQADWIEDIFLKGQSPVVSLSTYYSNNSINYPYTEQGSINQHEFLPHAFLEKEGVIIGTTMGEISEEVHQLVNDDGYGIRFNKLNRRETKTFRIRIPVEEFIKKFEIVL